MNYIKQIQGAISQEIDLTFRKRENNFKHPLLKFEFASKIARYHVKDEFCYTCCATGELVPITACHFHSHLNTLADSGESLIATRSKSSASPKRRRMHEHVRRAVFANKLLDPINLHRRSRRLTSKKHLSFGRVVRHELQFFDSPPTRIPIRSTTESSLEDSIEIHSITTSETHTVEEYDDVRRRLFPDDNEVTTPLPDSEPSEMDDNYFQYPVQRKNVERGEGVQPQLSRDMGSPSAIWDIWNTSQDALIHDIDIDDESESPPVTVFSYDYDGNNHMDADSVHRSERYQEPMETDQNGYAEFIFEFEPEIKSNSANIWWRGLYILLTFLFFSFFLTSLHFYNRTNDRIELTAATTTAANKVVFESFVPSVQLSNINSIVHYHNDHQLTFIHFPHFPNSSYHLSISSTNDFKMRHKRLKIINLNASFVPKSTYSGRLSSFIKRFLAEAIVRLTGMPPEHRLILDL